MGCGLFYSSRVGKQEPVQVYKPVEVKNPASPKPPPPGETAESGHWHGDEWHAEPHDTPSPEQPHASEEVAAVEAQASPPEQPTPPPAENTQTPPLAPERDPDFVNPTSRSSNPLFADGVPEHLQCPPELIGVYTSEISLEDREKLYPIGMEIIEKWNPNRPLTEVYPAFIEAQKWYIANADPERSKLYTAEHRIDWQLQLVLDFPEIGVLGREDPRSAFVALVELGLWEPDFNEFTLPDGSGRTFRTDPDKKYVFTWGAFYRETEDGFESSEGFVYTTGPSNGAPNAEVVEIDLDTITDEELERLGGWNYNINPYTTGAYKLGDNK